MNAAKDALEGELSTANSELDGLISKAGDLGYVFSRTGEFVSVDFRKMKELAEKFGISLDSLGSKFQGQRLAADAREIVNVKGDIYRARNNNYFALFMVTPEGIILVDPINTAFATWMKEQFAERFRVL